MDITDRGKFIEFKPFKPFLANFQNIERNIVSAKLLTLSGFNMVQKKPQIAQNLSGCYAS